MKIYWYEIIDDYVFQFDEKSKWLVYQRTGKIWNGLYLTESMELVVEV